MNSKKLNGVLHILVLIFALESCRPRHANSETKGSRTNATVEIIPARAKVCRRHIAQSDACISFQAVPQKPTWADGLVLAYLSKLAYQDEARARQYVESMQLDWLGSAEVGSDYAILVGGDDFVITAFRGTDLSLQDITKDTNFFYSGFQKGFSHSGFINGYNRLKSKLNASLSRLRQYQPSPRLYFTGHSLGGALATVAAFDYAASYNQKVFGLFTFGSPRVFSPALIDMASHYIAFGRRFVFGNDIITNLPGPVFFRHVGNVVYFNDACQALGEEDGWKPFLQRILKHSPLSQPVNFGGIPDHHLDNYIGCLQKLMWPEGTQADSPR